MRYLRTCILAVVIGGVTSGALASDIQITWEPVRPIVLGVNEADATGSSVAARQSSVAIMGTIVNTTVFPASLAGGSLYYLGHETYSDGFGVVGAHGSTLVPTTLAPGASFTGIIGYAFLAIGSSTSSSDSRLLGEYTHYNSSCLTLDGEFYSGFKYNYNLGLTSNPVYFRTAVVPEPATLATLGLGLIAFARRRRK